MSQQQPSWRCVIRVAAQDSPEFQSLCDSLQRNDPTVTTVATRRHSTPEGYGRQLGEALLSNNNSVVSEIDLYLSFLLSETDRREGTTSSITQLLTWIEQSTSLQNVTLRARDERAYDEDAREISPLLLQPLLTAMKMNPSIRVFHSHIYNFPLPVLTEYLSSTNTASLLQSLKIDIRSHMASDLLLEQAAQAISVLSGLRQLSLSCPIPFLKRLPGHVTRLLCELDVYRGTRVSAVESSDITLLSSILSSSKDLRRVEIRALGIDSKIWELIQGGLQSNPSITHLKLNCNEFDSETGSLIVDHLQSSSSASHQNIRTLELSFTETMCLSTVRERCDDPSHLAQMFSGSLLQHVSFDFRIMPGRTVAEFFTALSTNSSAIRLRSMHVQSRFLPDMTPYLSSTVHLRHFTFTWMPRSFENANEFVVQLSFLHSLRRNGSLHTVEFKSVFGDLYMPSDDVSRFIQAFTTRNRELSNLMKSSFAAANAEINVRSGTNHGNDAVDETGKNHLPTQCLTSQQAPATSPNATLQGLLASLDTLGTITSGCLQGKRAATASLEDSCD